MNTPHTLQPSITDESAYAVAYFAGGCFWCVESDLEKLPAVADAISGYMGGTSKNPTYGDYAEGGHREVVKVLYDPAQTSYADLVWHLIRHIDPTDSEGSFYDRGPQYSSAVYYQTDEERDAALAIIAEVDASDRFERPLALPVLKATTFYPAEEYHQEYAEQHPLKYSNYRKASGRDDFIEAYWGDAGVAGASSVQTPPRENDTATQ